MKLSGKWAVYVGREKIGRLSTVDEDGTPHTTPVFYVMMDGEVYVGTQRGRRKFRNMQRNPKVCFTIDSTESPYKGIMIQGEAEIIEDDAVHEKFREGLMYRYYYHPDNPSWHYIQSLGASVLVKINAKKTADWDFSGD